MEQHAQQTQSILMTTVARVLDYKALFQNDAKMREVLQPILKKLLDTLMITCLDDNIADENENENENENDALASYERYRLLCRIAEFVTYIQTSTGLDTHSLVTVLQALSFGRQVPENMQQQADTCFKILREHLIGTLDMCDELEVETPFDNVYLNICKLDSDEPTIKMFVQPKDVNKVTDIVSGLSGLSLSKRKRYTECSYINIDRVDTYVEFQFNEHNVKMFTSLLQCMSEGAYDIGNNIDIYLSGFGLNYLNLGDYDDTMKLRDMLIDEDFYERFQETYFKKSISLNDSSL
jgi:hypothetical protein